MLTPYLAKIAAVVIAVLVAAVALQTVRLSNSRAAHAKAVAEHASAAAVAEAAAREVVAANARSALIHTERQIEVVSSYESKIAALDRARRDSDDRLGRVRKSLAEFSNGDRRPTGTDADAVRHLADRLVTLGRLADEGASLVVEARSVIERRDAEVAALKAIVENDAEVCRK